MLIHLGGTTIPSPKLPMLMVTMDAKQGIELVRMINPDLTIPIHYEWVLLFDLLGWKEEMANWMYSDYDVFLDPLDNFKKQMEEAGLSQKVVYLDRKDQYKFAVQQGLWLQCGFREQEPMPELRSMSLDDSFANPAGE
jgi:hypothetical protein